MNSESRFPAAPGGLGPLQYFCLQQKMYFSVIIEDSFQYVISIIVAVNYGKSCLCTTISPGTRRGESCVMARHTFHFPFSFFFLRVHSPNWQQMSGSNSVWKASSERRFSVCCRLRRGGRRAGERGEGRSCPCSAAGLRCAPRPRPLPACGRAAPLRELAAAGGRDAESRLPLSC